MIVPDPAEILRSLALIIPPGQVTEIRALEATTTGYARPRTIFGYFDDPQKLVTALAGIVMAKGIYFTPNPVNPALLARAANRLKDAGKSETTGDRDIMRRRWLLVDCDPVRSAGISSTDSEHDAALDRAASIQSGLTRAGWPLPIMADSGNGAHLLYRVDLPADDGGLVERCLDALAALHGDSSVAIDRAVHNPARIWKLGGTWARKGDSTADRPHRMARIIDAPGTLAAVTLEQLEALAAQAPTEETPAMPRRVNGGTGDSAAWLDSFLARNAGKLPLMTGPESYQGGRRWTFNPCPWNAEHQNDSAFLIQRPDGVIQAGCRHNGCAKESWPTLRALIEPAAPARSGPPSGKRDARPSEGASAPVLVCLADVEPRAVEWLWHGRIPLGRITLLVGRPGEGKSFLATDIAARVTRGTPFPDGSACPSGSVILISAEDDPGDTIRPRLDAHNADVTKVHLLSGVGWANSEGERREVMFTLVNLEALEAAIKAHPDLRLIVIDPIGSYLGGQADAHRDNEVRGILAPVAKLAERYNVAVLIVMHRRKGTGANADEMALGSRAFTGIARCVWHLSRDPASKERRLLLPGKNNLAREGDGLAFTIEGSPPRLAWESGPVTMNADEGMAAENDASRDAPGRPPETRNAAADFLQKLLAGGSVDAGEVKRETAAAGLNFRTVQRAADTLGVMREKLPFGGGWRWHLPADDTPTTEPHDRAPNANNSVVVSPSVKQGEIHTLNPDGDRMFGLGKNVASSGHQDPSMRTPYHGQDWGEA